MLVNLFEGKWGLDDSCAGCFRATLGAVGGLRSSVSPSKQWRYVMQTPQTLIVAISQTLTPIGCVSGFGRLNKNMTGCYCAVRPLISMKGTPKLPRMSCVPLP